MVLGLAVLCLNTYLVFILVRFRVGDGAVHRRNGENYARACTIWDMSRSLRGRLFLHFLSVRTYRVDSLAQSEEHMARMTAGDELKLTLDPVGERAYGKPWEGLGQVLRIADSEVALMMLAGNVPLEITDGYQVTSPTRDSSTRTR